MNPSDDTKVLDNSEPDLLGEARSGGKLCGAHECGFRLLDLLRLSSAVESRVHRGVATGDRQDRNLFLKLTVKNLGHGIQRRIDVMRLGGSEVM